MASKRGISGKALGRVESGFDLGAPVFILSKTVAAKAGDTSETDSIYNGDAPFGFRVIDFWCHANSEPANDSENVKLTNGASDITDTVTTTGAGTEDTDVYRGGEIDDAYNFIPKGGSLKIVRTASTNLIGLTAYALCVRADS
jgi:hypothetical protein